MGEYDGINTPRRFNIKNVAEHAKQGSEGRRNSVSSYARSPVRSPVRIPKHIRQGIQKDLQSVNFESIVEKGKAIEERQNLKAQEMEIKKEVYGAKDEDSKSKVRFSVILKDTKPIEHADTENS